MGHGVTQDLSEAVRYFTGSAANGNPRALTFLRAMLLDEITAVGQVMPDLDHAALGLDEDVLDEDAAEELRAMAVEARAARAADPDWTARA